MTDSLRDVTRLPDLLHGRSHTGPVRERRPVYVDLLPPCNAGCPAGENIQAWLSHTQAGRHEQAWRQLVADNPLPAIHGRVCYHPCESVCNRANLDSAVSIHSVERFLGDLALEQGWAFDRPPARTGKRVLVVGAGPSGLSAAYHLARLGHEVEIRDAGEQTGGMMRYGIPAYRLPRAVLAGELDRIEAMGVRMTRDHRVEDLVAERAEGRLRRRLRRGRGPPVQAGRHPGAGRLPDRRRDLVPAQRRLRRAARDRPARRGVRRGQHCDGRCTRRASHGRDEPLIVYRRTREQMPAHEEEAEDAEREGVRINWLRTITAFDGPELQVELMELDESGYPQPRGRFETLAADTVILALGQKSDTAFLRNVPGVEIERDGTVQVSSTMMTGCPACSPAATWCPASAPSPSASVTARRPRATSTPGCESARPRSGAEARPRRLSTSCTCGTSATPRAAQQPELALEERDRGLRRGRRRADRREEAVYEAGRCLSCGNCFECDGCLGACPEDAVIKLGAGAPVPVRLRPVHGVRARASSSARCTRST